MTMRIATLAIGLVLSGLVLSVLPDMAQAQQSGRSARASKSVPAKQSPFETAKAMASQARLALQSDLAWTGFYNGLIDGEASNRLVSSIRAYQKDRGKNRTSGVLNPKERSELAAEAKAAQMSAGWKIVTDAGSGAQLGIPEKLVPEHSTGADGTRWSSPNGTIVIKLETRRDIGLTLAAMAEQEKNEQGRKVQYSVVRPDFFVVSGLQGLKRFYVRGAIKAGEIRTLTIIYDQATEGTMAPVVVAMSSAFTPFPDGPNTLLAHQPVEYATGTAVSADGAILASRGSVDGCKVIVVPGYGHATRLAEDRAIGLALLRVYGAQMKPIAATAEDAPRGEILVTGIVDPEDQNGGRSATSMRVQVSDADGEIKLSPKIAAGFAGAVAVDDRGRFAGIVVEKSDVATLAPASTIRAFLRANDVRTTAESKMQNPKASVVQLICVR